MENMEQMVARHKAEMAKMEEQLAMLEELGEIPGAAPYIWHSPYQGCEHLEIKLLGKDDAEKRDNLRKLLSWASERHVPVNEYRGRVYATMWPHCPVTRNNDYEDDPLTTSDAILKAEYYTASGGRTLKIEFFTMAAGKCLKISVDVGGFTGRIMKEEVYPKAIWESYGRGGHQRRVTGWAKPRTGITSHLYVMNDGKTGKTNSLIGFDELESLILE